MSEQASSEQTVSQARACLMAHIHEGPICPVCDQTAKMYPRTLDNGLAYLVWRVFSDFKGSTEWFRLCQYMRKHGLTEKTNYSLIRYWSLLEPRDRNPDEKNQVGDWRMTARGIQFAQNLIEVPKVAYTYNAELCAYSVETTNIKQALGRKWDYDDMMSKLHFETTRFTPLAAAPYNVPTIAL